MQTHGKRISIDLVQIDRAQASCTILLGDSIRCSYVASYVVVEFLRSLESNEGSLKATETAVNTYTVWRS